MFPKSWGWKIDPCNFINLCFIGLRDSGIDVTHLCIPWRLVEFEVSMNDQTAKADAGKPDLTLVPTRIIYEIEKIRSYGTAKYGARDNWKKVSIDRYWQATLRHILQAWDDVGAIDHESGLLHISHVACNIAFILELMKDNDDGMEKKSATVPRCDRCMYSDMHIDEEPCVKCLKLPPRNDFFRPKEFIEINLEK